MRWASYVLAKTRYSLSFRYALKKDDKDSSNKSEEPTGQLPFVKPRKRKMKWNWVWPAALPHITPDRPPSNAQLCICGEPPFPCCALCDAMRWRAMTSELGRVAGGSQGLGSCDCLPATMTCIDSCCDFNQACSFLVRRRKGINSCQDNLFLRKTYQHQHSAAMERSLTGTCPWWLGVPALRTQ